MGKRKKILTEDMLHDYQWHSADHIIDNPKSGLFLEMGLGKTVSTLTAIESLMYDHFDIQSCIVIAPKRVVETVWHNEVKKWKHLKHLTVSRVIGTEKQRLNALAIKADIHVIGRDNVAWLCGQYGGSMLPFDMCVIDESSSFKNPKAVRFKALKKVAFKRVVLLTGTPAPNGLIDLWSQVYLLDKGERLGKFIGHYRDRYFKAGARRGHIVYKYNIRKTGEAGIYKAIGDICLSMKAKDFLKSLPARVDNVIEVPFPEKLRKQYEQFEEDMVYELIEAQDGDGYISAANAAALSMKLRQFANGAIYDADKNWHEIHKLKLDALEEVIESAGGKPVLAAWAFRSDRDRILKRFRKYRIRELKKEQDVHDWNEGKIQIMTMHPASGGHGLNLQDGGNTIAWYGVDWSLELYQQFNARLHRQGQEHTTFINHIVVPGTIDMDIMKALTRKSDTQDGLMRAVKARIKKYGL